MMIIRNIILFFDDNYKREGNKKRNENRNKKWQQEIENKKKYLFIFNKINMIFFYLYSCFFFGGI